MRWKPLFEKGMFWILLSAFVIGNYFSETEIKGINKTVGWSIDLSNQWFYNGLMIFGSWIIFLIGYAILSILRKKTDLYLSIIHFVLFILTLIVGVKTDLFGFSTLGIGLISFIIFGANFFKSFKLKKIYRDLFPIHSDHFHRCFHTAER